MKINKWGRRERENCTKTNSDYWSVFFLYSSSNPISPNIMNPFSLLPDEVIDYIFSLVGNERPKLQLVCKRWKQLRFHRRNDLQVYNRNMTNAGLYRLFKIFEERPPCLQKLDLIFCNKLTHQGDKSFNLCLIGMMFVSLSSFFFHRFYCHPNHSSRISFVWFSNWWHEFGSVSHESCQS